MPPGCFPPPPQNSLWQSLWQPRTQLHLISSGYRMGGGEVDRWVQLGLSYLFFSLLLTLLLYRVWSSLDPQRLGCLSSCPSWFDGLQLPTGPLIHLRVLRLNDALDPSGISFPFFFLFPLPLQSHNQDKLEWLGRLDTAQGGTE